MTQSVGWISAAHPPSLARSMNHHGRDGPADFAFPAPMQTADALRLSALRLPQHGRQVGVGTTFGETTLLWPKKLPWTPQPATAFPANLNPSANRACSRLSASSPRRNRRPFALPMAARS